MSDPCDRPGISACSRCGGCFPDEDLFGLDQQWCDGCYCVLDADAKRSYLVDKAKREVLDEISRTFHIVPEPMKKNLDV